MRDGLATRLPHDRFSGPVWLCNICKLDFQVSHDSLNRISLVTEVVKDIIEEGQTVSDISSVPDFQGHISAAQLEHLQKSEGKTVDQIMLDLLPAAQQLARSPISNFRVGAVVRGASGSLYFGANLEIPKQPLALTVHAEQASAANAYMHGEESLFSLAVSAAPCGHCRQFLQELSPEGKLVVLVKGQQPVLLKSLLPAAFGPTDLGRTQGALPVKRKNIILSKGQVDKLTAAALSAACSSYAPYTKAHSGVAIGLSDGSIHAGSCIENAAFNPSLPPFQVALSSVRSAKNSFEQIVDVVLVEIENAAITHKPTIEAILNAISSKIRLRTVLGHLQA